MPVILHIKHEDSAVKAHRKAAAERVLSYCGDTLPPSRLLCFLDDDDSGSLNGERGRYQTIHKNTPLAGLPDYVSKHIDVDDERFFYYQRVVDELIYIYDSTCSNDIGLTMTLAHELHHSFQHSRARELWAVNSLIHQLPKSIIHDLKLTWADVPTEREARIV